MSFRRLVDELETGAANGLHLGWQVHIEIGGSVAMSCASGLARPDRDMAPDTIVSWLCATKPLLAVVLGQLYEEGQLCFDDRVTHYLPRFARHGKKQLMIEDLLRQRVRFEHDPSAGALFADSADVLREACDAVPAPPLPRDTGWLSTYSQWTAWTVLGGIAETILMQPIAEAIGERIFSPLGMLDSFVAIPPHVYPNVADRLALTSSGGEWNVATVVYEASQLSSRCFPGWSGRGPMRELAAFYRGLVPCHGGGGLLDRSTVALLSDGQSDPGESRSMRRYFGLGFMVEPEMFGSVDPSLKVFGHTGDTVVAFACPAADAVVAIFCNGMAAASPVLRIQRASALGHAVIASLFDQ